MKLKQVSIVTLKEKTLELEYNEDKYTFCFYFFSTFKYLKFLSILFVSSLNIYIFFSISFFLRDRNGKKAEQLFCVIPVAIDFLIAFRNS